jgi:metallo-beta-lactamase family protein
MCTGGRILHHLKNNIEDPTTHIVIVGYQVRGTLGRRIVEKEKTVRIFGQEYQNKAKLFTLGGFSGHGDQRDLRYWLRSFGHSPRKIFLVHGDEDIIYTFRNNLQNEVNTNTEIYVPEHREEVKLD